MKGVRDKSMERVGGGRCDRLERQEEEERGRCTERMEMKISM